MSWLWSSLVGRLTRSRILARSIFGLPFPRLGPDEHYFDATTLALRFELRHRIPRGCRVLDMGTGSAAVLGLWLWRARGCRVTCTDVDAAIVQRARESVRLAGAPIRVHQGSFFEDLDDAFDHVVFNPPYVPTAVGRRRELPERTRSQWDGGPEGTDVIAAFLEAFESAGGSAVAWMGVNHRHVSRADVERLCAQRAGIALRAVHARRWLPVDVYVLVRSQSPSASTSSPHE
jgi:methylase of polypeptide subunit release factors